MKWESLMPYNIHLISERNCVRRVTNQHNQEIEAFNWLQKPSVPSNADKTPEGTGTVPSPLIGIQISRVWITQSPRYLSEQLLGRWSWLPWEPFLLEKCLTFFYQSKYSPRPQLSLWYQFLCCWLRANPWLASFVSSSFSQYYWGSVHTRCFILWAELNWQLSSLGVWF